MRNGLSLPILQAWPSQRVTVFFTTSTSGVDDLPVGWFASISGRISGMFGVTGEVSGSYKTQNYGLVPELSLKVHSFMGGPTLEMQHGRLRPYVQVLFGLARYRLTLIPDPLTDFAVQPGAGVDITVNKSVGVRLGGAYRVIETGDGSRGGRDWSKQFQFVAGVVFYPRQ